MNAKNKEKIKKIIELNYNKINEICNSIGKAIDLLIDLDEGKKAIELISCMEHLDDALGKILDAEEEEAE